MQPELLKEQHIRCGDFKMLQIKMVRQEKHTHTWEVIVLSFLILLCMFEIFYNRFSPFRLVEKNTNFFSYYDTHV